MHVAKCNFFTLTTVIKKNIIEYETREITIMSITGIYIIFVC